jgi:hypothetical protein
VVSCGVEILTPYGVENLLSMVRPEKAHPLGRFRIDPRLELETRPRVRGGKEPSDIAIVESWNSLGEEGLTQHLNPTTWGQSGFNDESSEF